ncbi:restriction endonuclease [Streptomyces syringium]|uniref:restriction endonuclease n=1 Tax=Streptomyces syringium TaxID=76729 RepID=UPI0034315E1F
MIDRNAGVVPTHYSDPGLRKAVGELIGRADRDDLLRALILVSECRMAQDIGNAWAAHVAMLEREAAEAERRADGTKPPGYGPDPRNPVDKGAHRAGTRLKEGLARELCEAREAHQECVSTLDDNTYTLGHLPVAQAPGDLQEPDLLDAMAALRDQLRTAQQRFTEIMNRDRVTLHDLALQEEYRRSSIGAEESVHLRDIDRMDPGTFAHLVELLLQRDGCQTQRPAATQAGQMIAATADGGRRLTFFARRVDDPRDSSMGWTTGPASDISTTDIHRMHRLAAQCTDDSLIVVTNGGFSRPARRYAAQHRIGLLGRDALLRWAQWQEPFEFADQPDQNAA